MKDTYLVKANFKGRTIEFDIGGLPLSSALRKADEVAREYFSEAGYNTSRWKEESKVSLKKIK